MKVVQSVIASYGILYLQIRSVGSYSTSGMEKEGKLRGGFWNSILNILVLLNRQLQFLCELLKNIQLMILNQSDVYKLISFKPQQIL